MCHSEGDGDCGGGCPWIGRGGGREISELPAQFFCEPKIVLKDTLLNNIDIVSPLLKIV